MKYNMINETLYLYFFKQLFLGLKIIISKIGLLTEPDINLLYNFVHRYFYDKTTQ